MFVYLACSGGASSSMYGMALLQGAQLKTSLKVTLCDLSDAFKNQDTLGERYDLIFVYGPIDALRADTLFSFARLFSVVLVAPQVRYLLLEKQQLVKKTPLQVKAMPVASFGKMMGPLALDNLLQLLIPIDDARGAFTESYYQNLLRDKDFILLGMGGDCKQRFFLQLKENLKAFDIPYSESSFSLEKLFNPSTNSRGFQIYYGVAELLTPENLEAVLARVDLIFYYPQFHLYQKKLVKKIKETSTPIVEITSSFSKDWDTLVLASFLSEESKL